MSLDKKNINVIKLAPQITKFVQIKRTIGIFIHDNSFILIKSYKNLLKVINIQYSLNEQL